jgi:hypothetical protein
MKRCSRLQGLLAIASLLLVVATLNADTLVLRDGRRLQGRLTSLQNGVLEFDEGRGFGGRTLRFSRNDVLGVEFDRNEGDTPRDIPSVNRGGRQSGLREKQVMVVATQRWSDTTINVQAGQVVYFEADGEIHWGPNRRDGPWGEQSSPMNPNRPIPSRPAAALIGRVGEGSTDFFFIGGDRAPIRMRSSGRLFLGVNDDVLEDNSGFFRVVARY